MLTACFVMACVVATGSAAVRATPSSAQMARLKPPDVKFVPTPQSVVVAMLNLAKVTPADVVYDLGSGDGRIPITAAKEYGARGVGIEIDWVRIREANDNLKKAGVGDRVRFVKQDLFEAEHQRGDRRHAVPDDTDQSGVDAEAETRAEAGHPDRLASVRHGRRMAAGASRRTSTA